MLTPLIGMEPTFGAEFNSSAGHAGSESGEVGVFEQVLHDLLDPDTEENGSGIGVCPCLMIPSPMTFPIALEEGLGGAQSLLPPPVAWERGSGVPLDQLAEEPLQAGSIDAPSADAVEAIGTSSLPGAAEALAVQTDADFPAHLEAEERGVKTEPMTVLGGDFQSVQGGVARREQAADPHPVNGNEGTLPVSPARQGETPSTPVLDSPSADPDALQVSEPNALKRGSHEPPDLAHHDQHRTHAPHIAHATHRSASVVHTEPSVIAPSDRLAEPNWHMAEQMAQHIERMIYDRERDAITVRLDPPELGVIELRVQASGNEVQAWVSAERDLTRQLLQQAQQQLREQLESRGLQLTHFDIGGQSHSRFAQAQPPRTPAIQTPTATHPSTATDSLWYDGRWSVWV